ncbi:MAG: helix-turn-helix domain-containing protein [Chloroflexi bacterium]|nr:helix-turn-helix domain-containing protein [Chloroflexota bacterium]
MSNGWSIAEAAAALGVSEKTIRRHIQSGKLKARKVPKAGGFTYLIDQTVASELPASSRPTRPAEELLLDLLKERERLIASLQEERMKLVSQIGYLQSQIHHLQDQTKLQASSIPSSQEHPRSGFWIRLLGR